jgi:hypothetical protein
MLSNLLFYPDHTQAQPANQPTNLLPMITGDEFFTNGKGRETLGPARASRQCHSDMVTLVDRRRIGWLVGHLRQEERVRSLRSVERLVQPKGDGHTRSCCAVQ